MYHYVYRLDHIETGEFYVGSRSSKYHPTIDKYMGSMTIWKPDKSKLIKTIIKDDFVNRNDAVEYESELIKENINNKLNRNYHIPNKGFHTSGTVTIKDSNGETFNVLLDDPKYLSGELSHVLTNRVTVVNSNGNTYSVFKNDEKYLSGELISVLTGKVSVKDNNNITCSISINDQRYLSGELTYIWAGKKHSNETKRKIGEKNAQTQKGIKNSQFGTCWITNGISNKKIKKDDDIPQNWYKGRI